MPQRTALAATAAVTDKIALPVALKVQPAGEAASLNRMLPASGLSGLATPLDVRGRPTLTASNLAMEAPS